MAYDPNQQDNMPGQQQQQNPAMAPMTSSAPGAGPGSSSGKSSAPQATPAQPFQNLQAYLGANAPQTETQANTIAGNLQNQYGQVTGDVDKAQSNFGGQVKLGYAQADPTLTDSAASNPGAFVSNPGDVKAFQSLYNDTYGGPSSFEGSDPYTSLGNEVSTAAKNATNFDSLPGMQTYFQGQNPNATQGGNTLDAVLLSGNKNAISTVKNAAKPFSGLNDYLGNATTAADKGVSAAQTDAQNINQGLHTQFTGAGGVVPTWEKGIADQTAAAQAQADSYNKSVNNVQQQVAGMGGTLGDTEAAIKAYNDQNYNPAAAGVSDKSTLPAINYDLSQLSKVPDIIGAATPESVASNADFSNQAGLNQLLGIDLQNLNPANASSAGSYKVPGNASLPIQQAIDELTKEMGAANTGFTGNGALQYKGTPSDSIATNADIPPGYTIIPQSALGSGSVKGAIPEYNAHGEQEVAVPIGSTLPNGQVVGATPTYAPGAHGAQTNITGQNTDETGNTFVQNPGGHGSTGSLTPNLGAPTYYSNQPLNSANKEINDLLTYLQGIKQ